MSEVAGSSNPLILFDGVCNLCNGLVVFVIARDPRGRFKFAPLQSEAGRQIIKARRAPGAGGVPEGGSRETAAEALDTVVLVENDRLYAKSDAVLRIAGRLTFPWALAYLLIVVPRALRDRAYDFIARRRYGWFGQRDVCMAPTPELRARFLGN